MRILDENNNELTEQDIDIEKGEVVQTTIIKPDAIPVDDVTKFAYADEDYEVVMRYIRITDEELREKRISELKRNLADTDYVVIKMAEGAATSEEYADVVAQRAEWRKEINVLEAEKEDD